jgi:hypothetical protein
VIWSGAAAEALLDEVLQSLLWEELKRPEECVEIFAGSITSRVRSQYGHRLGGNWSFGARARGPVSEWFRDTASPRNRVVHGGYSPTFEDCQKSLGALNNLVTFVGDRIVNRTKQYPRTAWMLLGGEPGFERRNRNVPAEIKRRLADPAEIKWTETLFRWRECHARCRQDKDSPRIPDVRRSHIYVVSCPSGKRYFCFHDRVVAMAASAPFDESEMAPEHFRHLPKGEDEMRRLGRAEHAFSMGYPPGIITARPTSEWIEEYRLVPLSGVLADGSDLDVSCT